MQGHLKASISSKKQDGTFCFPERSIGHGTKAGSRGAKKGASPEHSAGSPGQIRHPPLCSTQYWELAKNFPSFTQYWLHNYTEAGMSGPCATCGLAQEKLTALKLHLVRTSPIWPSFPR